MRACATHGPRSASSSGFEANRKAFREIGFADGLLGASNVIGNATKLESSLIHVPDSIAGHRDAVAGLADAAGVDQGGSHEAEGVDAVVVCDLPVGQPEDPGDMSVAVKADLALEQLEVGVGHSAVEHILVNVVARACMHEHDL